MDMKMNSKDSTTAAGASAHQHHHQQQQEAIGAAVVEGRNVRQASQQAAARGGGERKPRPQPDEALRCPRCDSFNTKFCYYNNNSTLQPRHFCKACRRYWTQGGSLRNVPVGGGCRKNKRGGSASSSSSSIDKQLQQQHLVPAASSTAEPQHFPNVLPTFMSTGFDLPSSSHLLPFPPLSSLSSLAPAPPLPSIAETTTPSFLDMLRQGLLDHQGDGFYGPMMNSVMEPPPFGFGGVMQHGVVGDHGGGVAPFGGEGATAAATHQGQGGEGPTTQHVGANQQQEGASVPDTPRAK